MSPAEPGHRGEGRTKREEDHLPRMPLILHTLGAQVADGPGEGWNGDGRDLEDTDPGVFYQHVAGRNFRQRRALRTITATYAGEELKV